MKPDQNGHGFGDLPDTNRDSAASDSSGCGKATPSDAAMARQLRLMLRAARTQAALGVQQARVQSALAHALAPVLVARSEAGSTATAEAITSDDIAAAGAALARAIQAQALGAHLALVKAEVRRLGQIARLSDDSQLLSDLLSEKGRALPDVDRVQPPVQAATLTLAADVLDCTASAEPARAGLAFAAQLAGASRDESIAWAWGLAHWPHTERSGTPSQRKAQSVLMAMAAPRQRVPAAASLHHARLEYESLLHALQRAGHAPIGAERLGLDAPACKWLLKTWLRAQAAGHGARQRTSSSAVAVDLARQPWMLQVARAFDVAHWGEHGWEVVVPGHLARQVRGAQTLVLETAAALGESPRLWPLPGSWALHMVQAALAWAQSHPSHTRQASWRSRSARVLIESIGAEDATSVKARAAAKASLAHLGGVDGGAPAPGGDKRDHADAPCEAAPHAPASATLEPSVVPQAGAPASTRAAQDHALEVFEQVLDAEPAAAAVLLTMAALDLTLGEACQVRAGAHIDIEPVGASVRVHNVFAGEPIQARGPFAQAERVAAARAVRAYVAARDADAPGVLVDATLTEQTRGVRAVRQLRARVAGVRHLIAALGARADLLTRHLPLAAATQRLQQYVHAMMGAPVASQPAATARSSGEPVTGRAPVPPPKASRTRPR